MNKVIKQASCAAVLATAVFILLNYVLAPYANGVVSPEIICTLGFWCLVVIALSVLQGARKRSLRAKTAIIVLLTSGLLYQGWYWNTLLGESLEYYKIREISCVAQRNLLESNGLTVPSTVDSFPHPAAYCLRGHVGVFRTPYQYIQIYSLQDKDKQSRAIQLITDFHKSNATPPTILKMYGEENWIKDGNGGGKRGVEPVLRTVVIR